MTIYLDLFSLYYILVCRFHYLSSVSFWNHLYKPGWDPNSCHVNEKGQLLRWRADFGGRGGGSWKDRSVPCGGAKVVYVVHQGHLHWDVPAELCARYTSWIFGKLRRRVAVISLKSRVKWGGAGTYSGVPCNLSKAACVEYGAVVRHRNGEDKVKVYFLLPLYTDAVRQIVFCCFSREEADEKICFHSVL